MSALALDNEAPRLGPRVEATDKVVGGRLPADQVDHPVVAESPLWIEPYFRGRHKRLPRQGVAIEYPGAIHSTRNGPVAEDVNAGP